MALLNKLFFPTTTPTAAVAATNASTAAASTTTNLVSLASAWTTSSNKSAAAATTTATTTTAKRQSTSQTVHSKNYISQFPFDGSQVRLVLYRECDNRGRRLLFDSNALQKVPPKEVLRNRFDEKPANGVTNSNASTAVGNHKNQQQAKTHSNNFIEVCKEYGYRHNRPNTTDITAIGEMIFGALAMSFRGTALKVHWLKDPARLLCSEVFLTPVNSANAGHSPYSTVSTNSLATPRTSISSDHSSLDALSMSSLSIPFSISVARTSQYSSPLDVPEQQSLESFRSGNASSAPRFSSTYSNATDSGYSGMSSRSGTGSGSGAGTGSGSDQWSASYQYSTRSSLGSVMSENSSADPFRKLSVEYFPSSSAGSGSLASDNCLQRRISRNMRTSFENEHSMNDFIGFLSDNYPLMSSSAAAGSANVGGSEGSSMAVPYRRSSYSANETRSNPEIGKRRDMATMKTLSRRPKLGLAVCITMSEQFEEEMEQFCSEHIALLESMLSRIRANTERAYINHKDFLQIMFQSWQETQQWFNDLFTATRIKSPVWLSITTSGSKYSKSVAERFMKDLCWLLSVADTKDTNFFISTMLTAILTHHLGWVSTVNAFNSSTGHETASAAIEQRAKLLQISQKHPYNALWAQMGDLYGAIGMPPKVARTVIYGTEKLQVEKLLNVLTYFIRCGEVRRTAKREDFNKEQLKALISQSKQEPVKSRSNASGLKKSHATTGLSAFGTLGKSLGGGGMTRTKTMSSNLSTLEDSGEYSSSGGESMDEVEFISSSKKNEIPNVLAFRDSRFVQQELRIGNYLMDTGIEKSDIIRKQQQQHQQQNGGKHEAPIKLTVTTPDNVNMALDDDSSSTISSAVDSALEAIEIDSSETGSVVEVPATPTPTNKTTTAASITTKTASSQRSFFWNIVPQKVREGLSLVDLDKLQRGVHMLNNRRSADHKLGSNLQKQQHYEHQQQQQHEDETKQLSLSLSDLITQNSMGRGGDRMTWGIEPIKETVSLEEQMHFDFCRKLIEREHGICRKREDNKDAGGVVFVLGDNEPLVNIKKSNEDLSQPITPTPTPISHTLCQLHQRSAYDMSQVVKHSGVKFNFEQYPQIATNYMKSKNLVMSNYDLLMDKCDKMEASEQLLQKLEEAATVSSSSTTTTTSSAATSNCIMCNSISNSYQTPSNATELEFETDEVHGFPNNNVNVSEAGNRGTLKTVESSASIDTLKSSPSHQQQHAEVEACNVAVRRPAFNSNAKKTLSHRGSVSSVAAKCAAVAESAQLLKLPIPGIKELPQEPEPEGDMKLRAGFLPSLFLNVNDHYIADMVLQGTSASPKKWEMNLREDLALAAHSASLISLPAENIAIVADMDKYDVRLISSQSQCFPYAGGQSAPVGMSQLVSSMLEAVQAMACSGISAYECLSFLECKLQEIYLHSETLSSFLLETDFCPLSTVTTALHLTENDVPLLLSIASIHTPQISKKCGISFR